MSEQKVMTEWPVLEEDITTTRMKPLKEEPETIQYTETTEMIS